MHIKYTWDEDKRQDTRARRGIDFADMERFDWDTARTAEDARGKYGERRFVSLGYIGDRLHVCAWTPRGGGIRIISLRKANAREQKAFDRP